MGRIERIKGDAGLVIAVCDDDVRVLRQMADILNACAGRMPLRYRLFDNAEELLRAARPARFPHYFLDVMMPWMDGFTLCSRIRRGKAS